MHWITPYNGIKLDFAIFFLGGDGDENAMTLPDVMIKVSLCSEEPAPEVIALFLGKIAIRSSSDLMTVSAIVDGNKAIAKGSKAGIVMTIVKTGDAIVIREAMADPVIGSEEVSVNMEAPGRKGNTHANLT